MHCQKKCEIDRLECDVYLNNTSMYVGRGKELYHVQLK